MRRIEHPQVEMQIAPLIDVCFLLLFFYILTSKPVEPESELGMSLPGTVAQAQSVELPDEQRIEILASGQIVLNEELLDPPDNRELKALLAVLSRYKQTAEANKASALVVVDAADQASHQRMVDVLNTCARAGIKQVSLACAEGGAP